MKKLKHSLLALFILSSLSASAQLSFSVKGGLNVSNASMSFPEAKINPKTKIGFNVGAFGEYMLDTNMGIQSGIQLNRKGTKHTLETKEKISISLTTLQLPVHFVYKFEITDEVKIGLHAGPYAEYTLSGSWTKDDKGEGEVTTLDLYGKKLPYNFGRFDLGVGFGIQFEYEKYLVDIGYDLGLIDQIKDIKDYKGTLRSNNIYVSVGYRF